MRCLEENTLFDFLRDGLDAAARAAVLEHADACDSCRCLLAEAVQATPSPDAPTPRALECEHRAPSSEGRLLGGKYRLLHLLGAGGMGEVHEAINTWTGRRVAVKELHGDISQDALAVHRFTKEARSASRIAHPNVVEVLDLGEDPDTGTRFIVQELLTGSTLRQRLLERGRLSVEEAVQLIRPALSGLAVAHEAGVVHRDLKPENIFLAQDTGGREVVKLIDFGLSKIVVERDRLDITEHGRQLGTPYYMSPEQLRGDADVDERTDVWSMGVVLFELVAGVRPFAGPTHSDLVVQILVEPVPLLSEVVPGVSAAFAAVVERALQRDRAGRFSARDLCDALDELGRRPDALRLPPGNPYRGIAPFEAEDRALFFGRTRETGALIDRLRGDRFVLVAGDAGVGKSSLVRAGVLPRVREGALGQDVVVAVLEPGPHPARALAAALGALTGAPVDLASSRLAADVAAALGGRQLLLVVDPMEELVTLAEEGAAAAAAALAALLDGPVRLLATLRSDSLARIGALPGLGDLVTRALHLLKPMSRHAMRDAVVGPARLAGLRFDPPELVDDLLDAAEAPGELALLQFALAQLWEERDVERGMLCAGALASLGGVSGALARHADGVLALIAPRQRPLARRFLTALVSDGGARLHRSADDLGGDGDARAVLDILAHGQLVTVDRDAWTGTRYRLAHDALITGWDTLRGWLGREVERGAARRRLRRAAAEWDRLGQPADSLWRDRQLAEVADVDARSLPAAEAAFLSDSRRAERRRRARRMALLLGVPLLVGLGFAGARLASHRDLEAQIGRHVAAASRSLARAPGEDEILEQDRRAAFAAFDRGRAADGEEAWSSVLERQAALDGIYAEAAQQLELALALDGARREVRQRLADVLHRRARLAERARRISDRDEHARRMLAYDDGGEQRAAWNAPGRVTLVSSPPGAEVIAQPYVEVRGRMRPGPARRLGTTPLDAELAAGSDLLTIRVAGRPDVRSPILVDRGEVVRLDLPLPERVPEGTVYVPPGRFLYGSSDPEDMRRTMMNAQPLHPVTTAGYFIGRHEVTFGEWIEFLRELPRSERARRMPHTPEVASAHAGAFLQLAASPAGFRLSLQPTSRLYVAGEGAPIRYDSRETAAEQDWLRMPVSGISWDDALAYAAWLDRTGRLTGARPCDEREWERAARGADGRLFPHGDRLEPADADLAESYGRQPAAFGPDEVGTHAASDSPFGAADLAGNAWEWVASVSGNEAVAIRGGSWYHNPLAARSNNREPCEPSLRAIVIGLRICASLPGPRQARP